MASEFALFSVFGVAVVTTGGGFWIAAKRPSWYSDHALHGLVAIGTGLLLSVGLLEFLPVAFSQNPQEAPILIIAGLLFILFVENYLSPHLNFLEGHDCHHDHAKDHDHKEKPAQEHTHHLISHQAACSAVGCLVICGFFDGFEMLTAFSISTQTGWTTCLGLLFHVLPDGVLAASIALAGGMSKARARLVSSLTGGMLLLGALLASSLLGLWPESRPMILAFSTGVLLYVVLMHLLPVGMKHRKGFFLITFGGLLFLAIHLLSHSH